MHGQSVSKTMAKIRSGVYQRRHPEYKVEMDTLGRSATSTKPWTGLELEPQEKRKRERPVSMWKETLEGELRVSDMT